MPAVREQERAPSPQPHRNNAVEQELTEKTEA
jgi:hypothetical protein